MMWKRCCATRNYMPKPGVFAWKSCPRSKRRALPQLSFNKVHNWRTKPSRCLPWTSTGRVPRRVTRVTPYLFSSLAWSHSVSCGRIGSKALVPEPLRWSPGRPLVVPWWSPGGPLSHGIPGGHAWVTAADSWSCDGSPLSVGYKVGRCREFMEFTSVGKAIMQKESEAKTCVVQECFPCGWASPTFQPAAMAAMVTPPPASCHCYHPRLATWARFQSPVGGKPKCTLLEIRTSGVF